MMEESTSVGAAIQASVSDPSSAEATFVPFNRGKSKTKLQKRNNKMNEILKSINFGGLEGVMSSIKKVISESCDVDSVIKRKKRMLECKKNKEEFKRLMDAKKTEKENGEKKPKEQKKLSLKEKLALAKNKKKTVSENATCEKCGKEQCICETKQKCECCGKEDCICEDVNGKKCCPECSLIEKKKTRINEGIRRIITKRMINEAKSRIAEKKNEKTLNESSDFSKEMEIMKAARKNKLKDAHEKRKELSEAIDSECKNVMVGIVIDYFSTDAEINEEINSYANEVGMELADDKDGNFVFGMSLSENKDKSFADISNEVDKVSAGLFEILKKHDVDVARISSKPQILVVPC